ncbi:MAG: NAD-dependent epimerase/dehydratase family protein [Betaproteobacteria bacterium]|nr:NAD-dependent epimerase/dehydratase family protein [Betaproteobacteria bacterium]
MSLPSFAGRTVLVTGATGFVGSHLARRLSREGAHLKLLVRDPASVPADLAGRAEICRGDLTDATTLGPAVQGTDWIFHCAANVSTWDRAEHYEATNVTGVRHLLQTIEVQTTLPQRLVHVSTVDVYGLPAHPCDESCAPCPPGFGYGDSKLRGERVVHEHAQRIGLPYVILRPANVMGSGSPFIERVGRELQSGLMLRVAGGATDAGFLYVENLVDCLLWAARAPQAMGETYNVADSEAITWRRFLDDLRQGIGGKGWILDLPYAVAYVAAAVVEAPYRLLRIRREPLLHRMIVKIFGHTCGHSAAKLAAAGCPVGRVPYAQAMAASIAWFQANHLQ